MPRPTAKSFIAEFERIYGLLGPGTFPFLGLVQLHSGPWDNILEE